MFDFYQKRKLKHIFGSRWIQGLLLILACMVLWSAFNRYQIAAEMAERREVVEQEVQELKERRDDLKKQVDYLSNERGLEAEMRRQFDVAKKGEKVIVIVDEDSEELEIIPLSASTTEKSWYEFWR